MNVMKIGMVNNEIIILQAHSMTPKIPYVQLKQSERGKRQTPISNDCHRGGCYKGSKSEMHSLS